MINNKIKLLKMFIQIYARIEINRIVKVHENVRENQKVYRTDLERIT